MRFADGSEAKVEEVTPAPAIRADAERALTDGLARLPDPPLAYRPTLRYFLSLTPGVVGGFHHEGQAYLWIGVFPAWPAAIRQTVRHELAHEWMDSRKLRPHNLADEEAAAEAFANGDSLPLHLLLATERIARALAGVRTTAEARR